MVVKIKFEIKETKQYVFCETKLEEKDNMFGEIIHFEAGGKKYAYPVGSMKVYRSKGNVACSENIKLNWINVEYKFC